MQNATERLKHWLADIIEEQDDGERTAPLVRNVALDRAPTEILDEEIVQVCVEFTIYQFTVLIIKQNGEIIKRQKTREARLAELNVPHAQRKVIISLGMDNARCPIKENQYIDLYGPNRGTSAEIQSAADAYVGPIKSLQRKRALLERLARLVREEEDKERN
jgi:hypothetical protein